MSPEVQLVINIGFAVFLALLGYLVKQRDRQVAKLQGDVEKQKDRFHDAEIEQTRLAGVVAGLEKAGGETITRAEWKQWAASVERTLDELKAAILTGHHPYRPRAATIPGVGTPSEPPKR